MNVQSEPGPLFDFQPRLDRILVKFLAEADRVAASDPKRAAEMREHVAEARLELANMEATLIRMVCWNGASAENKRPACLNVPAEPE